MSLNRLTTSEYEEKVLASTKPVLLDFWSEGCGPCATIAPLVEEIANERDDIDVYSVNIAEESELAARLFVMAAPTLLVVVNGKTKKKSIGFKSKEHILEMIDAAIG